MAYAILEDGSGTVRQLEKLAVEEGGGLSAKTFATLLSAVQRIISRLNGFASLGSARDGYRGGSLDAQYRVVTVTPSAIGIPTQVPLAHGLKRVPVGYIMVGNTATGFFNLVDSKRLSWTDTLMYVSVVSGDVLPVEIRLLIF